ncbi:uncharacterized protein LOC110863461 isoform X2 [Folsomia candida]|uniref:uncharacterized protein LOC110863461 isoform X2 n=1 Tax=Folsomia candida TaxID=158441 RepID=UPI000B906C62|nr:uncharacterized protein LOC110863461 isoform X2 [Folsomia candida]
MEQLDLSGPSSVQVGENDDETTTPVRRTSARIATAESAKFKVQVNQEDKKFPPGKRKSTQQVKAKARLDKQPPKKKVKKTVKQSFKPVKKMAKKNKGTATTAGDVLEQKACDLVLADFPLQDREWFDEASRICKICRTMYKTCQQASLCVTNKHGQLRCYLCFDHLRNTEALFDHYRADHTPSGRENVLICNYCSNSVPFKSVSSHVISMHLSEKATGRRERAGVYHARTQALMRWGR